MGFDDQMKVIIENEFQNCTDLNEGVEAWEKFVAKCEEGFDESLEEHKTQSAVRGDLEVFLDHKELAQFPEYNQFKEKINELDSRFKLLFLEGVVFPLGDMWWGKGILKNGSGTYEEELLNGFGLMLK